jgi:hypothetical protein
VPAELKLAFVNGAFLAAGSAVLLALDVYRTSLGALAAAGLAYLTGLAVVMLSAIALLTVGVPFNLVVFAGTAAVVTAGGVAVAWRRRRTFLPRATPPRSGLDAWAPRGVDGWALLIYVSLFAVFALTGLRRAWAEPLYAWDGWSIWARKAIALTHFDGLVTRFFGADAYAFMHPDYPILLPLLEAVHFRAMGSLDTQAVHVVFWLLLVAALWAMAFLASRITRPLIYAPILLAAALAPGVWEGVLSAYADVPMALFLAVGALLIGLWLAQGRPTDLALGALFLAAAASTKNEGLSAALAVLVASALVLAAEHGWRALRQLAVAGGAVVVAVLPWRAWVAAEGIESDFGVERLGPNFLLDRLSRLGPATQAIGANFADQNRWHYLVPLACSMAIICIARRSRASRIAAFYLASGILSTAFLLFAYWIGPFDLGWHIATSAQRVVAGPVFLALAALSQLSGDLDPP